MKIQTLISAVSLMTCSFPAFAQSNDAAVKITVPGIHLNINGTTQIPAGLFGTHAVPLDNGRMEDWGIEAHRSLNQNPDGQPQKNTTPILMECYFDRYQPALLLNDPNWKTRLDTLGRTYGEAAKNLEREPIMEFWNEPYLNWAVKPGVNYDGGLYQGPPVPGETMRTKIGGERIEGLVWDAPRPVAIRDFDPGKDNIDYLATRFMPPGLKAGENFTWRNKPFRVEDRWWGKDTGQPESWWSGPVNREYYHRMLAVFAPALKETNPDVTLVVGWGFHLNESRWTAWHTLHKPLIDFAHQWIDGYNEHHYGGNTRMVAGTYETAFAYTLGAHGKKLKFYNTEAGGMLDPERPGSFNSAVKGTPVEQARGAYTYMMRDVLHLIDTMPDKAITRFAHEAHHHKGGGETAFKMFKPLRGNLMKADVAGDPNVWAVASLNDNRYTVIVFNDHYQAKNLELDIVAPAGFSLDGGTIAKAKDLPGTGMTLDEQTLAYSDKNSSYHHKIRVEGKDAIRYHFALKQEADAKMAFHHVRQFPAPEVLQQVSPGTPRTFTVNLPEAVNAAETTATLRFVHDSDLRWRPEDLQISINGHQLPARVSTDYICDIPLPVKLLEESNEISFSLPEGTKGALLCTASILLEGSR